MKRFVLRAWVKVLLGLLAAVLVGVPVAFHATHARSDRRESPRDDTPPGPLKRIILLKFETGLLPEKIQELTDGILLLKHKIPEIASLNVLPNTNTTDNYALSKGFTHVVLVTFKNTGDRAAFLANPIHKAYENQVLVPHLKDFLVIEFEAPSPL